MSNHHREGPGIGVIGLIQRITTLLVSIIETRLQLLAVELEEEKSNLITLLLMSGVALLCLGFGLMGLLILISWTITAEYRFIALAIFTGCLLLTALIVAILTIRKVKKSTFLTETRNNLKQDKELLQGRTKP